MAKRISEELMNEALALAVPLQAFCTDNAQVAVEDGASDEMIRAALNLQGFTIAMQALLRAADFTEPGIMAAMGTVMAVILVQCEADRPLLWKTFNTQMASVISELTRENPVLAPSQGTA